MPTSRRVRIEEMLAADPRDTFLRYGLAMEMAAEGDLAESVTQLASLLEATPPYVPAFFMSAQNLVRLGRLDEARDVLRRGIDHAQQQSNAHAAREMTEYLENLDSP